MNRRNCTEKKVSHGTPFRKKKNGFFQIEIETEEEELQRVFEVRTEDVLVGDTWRMMGDVRFAAGTNSNFHVLGAGFVYY